MGKTISEKILSQHAGRSLRAGDVAVCGVDFCFGQDNTSSCMIDSFRQLGTPQPFDAAKFCMVIDHSSPSPSIGVATAHARMRGFARELQLEMHDIGCGVCHQTIPERGHATCGDLILGADSHACTYGALNIFAAGISATDLAVTLACGKNWLRVPETIKISVRGKLPAGVYAKDIMLAITRMVGVDGAHYKAIEFTGDAIADMSIDARFTMANMVAELGAKAGLMEADKKTLAWVAERSRRAPAPVAADRDAKYCREIVIDASRITPQIARPHAADNVVPVEEGASVRIDQAFLGTCTNGRLEDLEIAAKILKGRQVHHDVRFIVAPASDRIYLEAGKKGLIDIFIGAGCAVVAPGCGPCMGASSGVLADGEVAISTSSRNMKGRMGNPQAAVYLASPATVAASAIAGSITDPRSHARRLRS